MARKPRSSIIQTPRHAIFFFAMFILGAIVLSLAKIVNLPSGWEKVIIVSLSLILMITYAVFITLVPATRLRLDAAADNMYYLGFLYTLTSLAVALTVDDTDQILANFGVAISSTLIGIAARVGLNQLRVDPHDIEAASRLELSEATSRIRSEMDDAVLQLSSFRTMNLQVLTEGYEELQENIKRISDEMYSTLNEMIEKTSIPFNELAEKTSEANKKITSSLDELKSSNDDLVQSNRTAVTQIGRVNKALEGLQKHYSDTGIVDDKVIAAVQEQLLLLQNQLTKEAISLTWPRRPIGILPCSSAIPFSPNTLRVRSVSIIPGPILFARIPITETSAASAAVIPSRPNLLEEYDARYFLVILPKTDVRFTILPQLFSFI